MWFSPHDHLRSLSPFHFHDKTPSLGLPAKTQLFSPFWAHLLWFILSYNYSNLFQSPLWHCMVLASGVQYRAHSQAWDSLSTNICQITLTVLAVDLKRATFRMRTEWESKENWKWHCETQKSPDSWALILDVKNEQTWNVHFSLKPDAQH